MLNTFIMRLPWLKNFSSLNCIEKSVIMQSLLFWGGCNFFSGTENAFLFGF